MSYFKNVKVHLFSDSPFTVFSYASEMVRMVIDELNDVDSQTMPFITEELYTAVIIASLHCSAFIGKDGTKFANLNAVCRLVGDDMFVMLCKHDDYVRVVDLMINQETSQFTDAFPWHSMPNPGYIDFTAKTAEEQPEDTADEWEQALMAPHQVEDIIATEIDAETCDYCGQMAVTAMSMDIGSILACDQHTGDLISLGQVRMKQVNHIKTHFRVYVNYLDGRQTSTHSFFAEDRVAAHKVTKSMVKMLKEINPTVASVAMYDNNGYQVYSERL